MREAGSGRRGFVGRRGGSGGGLADPGAYRVMVTLGEASWEVPLVVKRAPGFAADGFSMEEQEERRQWEKLWR